MIKDLLEKYSKELGISLSPEQLKSFALFYDEIKKWGPKINITALLNDEERLIEELFIDSLAPLLYIRKSDYKQSHLLDMGSGGGFPGIPLQIAETSLQVTLCDSIEKKIFFVRNVIRKLNLQQAEALCFRFGSDKDSPLQQNSFDWATSKAVTDIEELAKWALPYLKPGGRLLCMKSPVDAPVTLPDYKNKTEISYCLPFNKIKRKIYIYEKLECSTWNIARSLPFSL